MGLGGLGSQPCPGEGLDPNPNRRALPRLPRVSWQTSLPWEETHKEGRIFRKKKKTPSGPSHERAALPSPPAYRCRHRHHRVGVSYTLCFNCESALLALAPGTHNPASTPISQLSKVSPGQARSRGPTGLPAFLCQFSPGLTAPPLSAELTPTLILPLPGKPCLPGNVTRPCSAERLRFHCPLTTCYVPRIGKELEMNGMQICSHTSQEGFQPRKLRWMDSYLPWSGGRYKAQLECRLRPPDHKFTDASLRQS